MSTARKKHVKEKTTHIKQTSPKEEKKEETVSAPTPEPLSKPLEDVQAVVPPEATSENVVKDSTVQPQAQPAPEPIQPVQPIQPEPMAQAVPQTPIVESQPKPDPLADFKNRLQNDSFSNPPQKKNFMWPILFIFILAIAVLGGIFLYKQSENTEDEGVNVVSVVPTTTDTPTPTAEEIDLSEYEIEVLNGSEVAGEAGRQQESLEEEGFTVSSVGNAETSDYTETIIQAKEDVDEEFLDKLKEFLEEAFVVGETEELSEDAESDVVVIIGRETN